MGSEAQEADFLPGMHGARELAAAAALLRSEGGRDDFWLGVAALLWGDQPMDGLPF